MKIVTRILASLIGTLIALVLVNLFNIFEYISIIPADSRYDIGITIYFTLIEIAVDMLYDKSLKYIESSKAHIEAILYLPNQEYNVEAVPNVRLNDYGMAEMRLHIGLSGKSNKIKNSTIMILAFQYADMQFEGRGTGAQIDNQGNLVIDLKDLCNNRTEIKCEEEYKIVLQRGAIDNGSEIVLEPEIKINGKKDCFTKYTHNKAIIVLEGN